MSTIKIVAIKNDFMCNSGVSENDNETPVTSRMPNSLIAEIMAIAKETSRSRSKVIVLLLKRGIEAYRSDGVLVDTRPKYSSGSSGPIIDPFSGAGSLPVSQDAQGVRQPLETIKVPSLGKANENEPKQKHKKRA
ncbi:MAG: hypothetical protein WBV94_29580 [Blastocatellia bacterium]